MLSLLLLLACSNPDSSPAPVEAAECDCEGTAKADSKADSAPVEEQMREIRYDCTGHESYLAEVDADVTMPPSALIQVWAHYSDWFVEQVIEGQRYNQAGDYYGPWEQVPVKMTRDGELMLFCEHTVLTGTQEEVWTVDYYTIYIK